MSAGKIVLLIFGILSLVMSLPLLFGGGALLWANYALIDSEGFFTTRTIHLDQDSYAIVTAPADIDLGAAWLWDWGRLVTFKVEGSNNDSSKQIFMGVAEESDLNAYLDGVKHDEITSFSIYPFRLTYVNHQGDSQPTAPTSETFWMLSAYGAGIQTLEWEPETGRYSLVLMNDDGSAGVDLSAVFGMRVPPAIGMAVGFLVGGILALMIGIPMVYLALRRPQAQQPTQSISEVSKT